MSDRIKFDVSELATLAEDLRGAGQRFSDQVPRIIKRGAQNIKTDAQQRIRAQSRGGYVKQYPSSISYDIEQSRRKVTATIGPDKSKAQGALGNLLEYGSAKNAPLPHLVPAFEAEVPKTQAQLQAAAIGAVLRK